MIKTFESFREKSICWKVPLQQTLFAAALLKIMPLGEVDYWTDEKQMKKRLAKYNENGHIFIIHNVINDRWNWSRVISHDSNEYTYKGEITPTQEEIEEAEAYLASKKYNV